MSTRYENWHVQLKIRKGLAYMYKRLLQEQSNSMSKLVQVSYRRSWYWEFIFARKCLNYWRFTVWTWIF